MRRFFFTAFVIVAVGSALGCNLLPWPPRVGLALQGYRGTALPLDETATLVFKMGVTVMQLDGQTVSLPGIPSPGIGGSGTADQSKTSDALFLKPGTHSFVVVYGTSNPVFTSAGMLDGYRTAASGSDVALAADLKPGRIYEMEPIIFSAQGRWSAKIVDVTDEPSGKQWRDALFRYYKRHGETRELQMSSGPTQ